MPIFLASAAVTFINPYGWKLYGEIFNVFLSGNTTKYIIEWQSALSINFLKADLILIGAVFSALAILYWRKYSLNLFLPGLFFLLMFLRSIRMAPLFFVTAVPIIEGGFNFIRQEIRIKIPNFFKALSFIFIKNCLPAKRGRVISKVRDFLTSNGKIMYFYNTFILSDQKFYDLKDVLLKNDWKIAYEDKTTIILDNR